MFGWKPNPAGVLHTLASLPHPGELYAAAPHWEGDGLTGDLKPYLAWFDVEVPAPDGSMWKAKGAEPPWAAQLGNNCTSEAVRRILLLMQCLDAADPGPDATDAPVPADPCVEATYAFGLFRAGMRGDQGCYGAAMAEAAHLIGAVSYATAGEPFHEDFQRLEGWANDPASIVEQLGPKAAPFRVGSIARISSWEEYCALIANSGLATIASNWGFESPRDQRGICAPRGTWLHQMAAVGVIRSDGVESAVLAQSWGPGQPNGITPRSDRRYIDGPQPHHLPSYCFRVERSAFEQMLRQGDSWGFTKFPGFARRPLPAKWTTGGWGG